MGYEHVTSLPALLQWRKIEIERHQTGYFFCSNLSIIYFSEMHPTNFKDEFKGLPCLEILETSDNLVTVCSYLKHSLFTIHCSSRVVRIYQNHTAHRLPIRLGFIPRLFEQSHTYHIIRVCVDFYRL